MNRLLFLFCLLLVGPGNAMAQYQAANWPLMSYTWMLKIMPSVFDVDTLLPSTGGFIANASISDQNGNLLLSCLDRSIASRNGDYMENGDNLCDGNDCPATCNSYPSPHFQGVIILPRPGSSSQYYVFIKDHQLSSQCQPGRVTASLVDLTYNNGLGKVRERAKPILVDTLSDCRMTACKHANGRDWWLINHQHNSGKVYTQLITPDSIYPATLQSIYNGPDENDNAGWSLFSLDGDYFATTTAGMKRICLYSFDRCSGTFSNYREILPDSATGWFVYLAFSPNGKYLYAGNSQFLHQYDISSSNINASGVLLIKDTIANPQLGSIALACDQRLYITGWTGTSPCFSVITEPNLKAPLCNFQLRSVCIPNAGLYTVPNFPNYNLGAEANSACDTLSLSVTNTITGKQGLSIAPNPGSGWVSVKFNTDYMQKEGPLYLDLINSKGQLIQHIEVIEKTGLLKIDVETLSGGLYYFRLYNLYGFSQSALFAKL